MSIGSISCVKSSSIEDEIKAEYGGGGNLDPEQSDKIEDAESLWLEYEKAQKEQGCIGKTWDKFKTKTGLGLGSDDIETAINKFENGEIDYKNALDTIQSFRQKQNGMVDIVANIASGLTVVASMILTGGLSALGGAAIGGSTKAAIKTLDRSTNEIKGDALKVKQIAKDVITGAVDGVVTVGTAGMVKGPVMGQSLGSAIKNGVIQGAKAGAYSGAATSATNYCVEAAFEKDVDFKADELIKTTAQGAVIGGTIGGAMGGISGGVAQAKFNSPDVVELAENLHITNGDVDASDMLSNYLAKNKNLNLGELNNYIKNTDMESVYKIAPQVRDYNPKQLMNFYDYHFKNGTQIFDADALTLNANLTQYLRENYTNSEQLSELLDVHPLTAREVGDMPEGWLSNLSSEAKAGAQKDIYKVISTFQQNKSTEELAEELSKITGKTVQVEQLGSGSFGTGYKVSMEGADDTVLKIFDGQGVDMMVGIHEAALKQRGMSPSAIEADIKKFTEKLYKMHGQHIEPQTGLFVNEHSDDFVQMSFGKVAGTSDTDGFLVTQFLGEGVTPASNPNITGGYRITSKDAWKAGEGIKGKIFRFAGDHNVINDRIMDYGAVEVRHTGFQGLMESLKKAEA